VNCPREGRSRVWGVRQDDLQRSSLITSIVTHECSATSTAHVREVARRTADRDQVTHRRRYWQSREEAGTLLTAFSDKAKRRTQLRGRV